MKSRSERNVDTLRSQRDKKGRPKFVANGVAMCFGVPQIAYVGTYLVPVVVSRLVRILSQTILP